MQEDFSQKVKIAMARLAVICCTVCEVLWRRAGAEPAETIPKERMS